MSVGMDQGDGGKRVKQGEDNVPFSDRTIAATVPGTVVVGVGLYLKMRIPFSDTL